MRSDVKQFFCGLNVFFYVVVINESNVGSYFHEVGNLNGGNADMCSDVAGLSSSSLGNLFDFGSSSSSCTFTISSTTSTTGHHLGFECDYNFHTAFQGMLHHYV